MDTLILITHIVTVQGLIAFAACKTFLLYRRKLNTFERVLHLTQPYLKIPLSLILLTGSYLLFRRPEGMSAWLVVKFLVLIAATILLRTGEQRRQRSRVGIALSLYLYIVRLAKLKDPGLSLSTWLQAQPTVALPSRAPIPGHVVSIPLQQGQHLY